jgi:UDP-N-acetylglucosamine 2-epimerase
MRENTERPVTVTQGTNQLVGLDPQTIITEGLRALESIGARHVVPELWDGRASERIVHRLAAGRTDITVRPSTKDGQECPSYEKTSKAA